MQSQHSSLLRKSVNCGRKKFYSTGPWAERKIQVINLKAEILCKRETWLVFTNLLRITLRFFLKAEVP
jgi:hypothetical protein